MPAKKVYTNPMASANKKLNINFVISMGGKHSEVHTQPLHEVINNDPRAGDIICLFDVCLCYAICSTSKHLQKLE